jgi:hypothetical protein
LDSDCSTAAALWTWHLDLNSQCARKLSLHTELRSTISCSWAVMLLHRCWHFTNAFTIACVMVIHHLVAPTTQVLLLGTNQRLNALLGRAPSRIRCHNRLDDLHFVHVSSFQLDQGLRAASGAGGAEQSAPAPSLSSKSSPTDPVAAVGCTRQIQSIPAGSGAHPTEAGVIAACARQIRVVWGRAVQMRVAFPVRPPDPGWHPRCARQIRSAAACALQMR